MSSAVLVRRVHCVPVVGPSTHRSSGREVAETKGEVMRSRSQVRTLFATLAITGGALGAASVAGASTDTTTPADTASAGTVAPAGSEAPHAEAGGAGPGAGSGRDSGIEGADLSGTEVSVISVETTGSAEGDATA